MQQKTVYVLQDEKDLEQFKSEWENDSDFRLVGATHDGISAIAEIAEKKPDVLITELVVKGYDGLLVIRKLRELGITSKIMVISALSRDEVVANAMELGANYFMAKPVSFDVLKQRVLEMLEEKKTPSDRQSTPTHKISLEEKISKIFINVGIPPHIKGYSFLREGVKMAVEDPDVINNITKKLYPSIGEKYQTTASKVERAIRHAIEVAWNRGRIDNINNILGVRAFMGTEKPTNGEFIALVADKMLLEKA